MGCVERVCAAGILTPDLGGSSDTQGVVDAVCLEVEGILCLLTFNGQLISLFKIFQMRRDEKEG
jgi:hypothetical protein